MPARKVKAKPADKPKPPSITMPVPVDDPELSESAKRMLKQAQSITVKTAEDYETATIVLQTITAREKEVEAEKAKLWDPLAELTKAVQTLFNPPLKVLKQAKEAVAAKVGAYAQEQENIRRERQLIADREAEDTRQKLLEKAERVNRNGDEERAAVIEARAESIQAPTIERDLPQVSGISLRKRWLFEVTDEAEVPAEYRSVDEAKIRKAVNQYGDKIEIAGVRIWSTLKPQGS